MQCFRWSHKERVIEVFEGYTARELSRFVKGDFFDGRETQTSVVTDGYTYRDGRRCRGRLPKGAFYAQA